MMQHEDPLKYMYRRLEELTIEAIKLGAMEANEMNNGWSKFHKYIGVQGILALALTATLIYMLVAEIPTPDVLVGLLGTSWGFYFAKNGTNVVAAVRKTP